MNARHTPGPWIVRGKVQVMAHREHPSAPGEYNEESVFSAVRPVAEREANARLIAAAPEMLAALEQIEALAREIKRSIPAAAIVGHCMDAIRKAKGE